MKKVNKSNWRLWKTVGWIYELTKKAFNIDGDSIGHEEQKKHLMNLLEKKYSEFFNLIYEYHSQGRNPKDL